MIRPSAKKHIIAIVIVIIMILIIANITIRNHFGL